MRPRGRARWDYARAGVSRARVAEAVRALLRASKYRPPSSVGRPIDAPGHFAGLIRVGVETLAATTDTVGTKVLVAAAVGRWEEVGEDMVAINVNDLAAVAARPFGIVDVVSCARPDPIVFKALGRGLLRGLRAARCALLGGETAMVPELVPEIDLGGTALGYFPRGRRPILGNRIRKGDLILGLASSGVHANGFTLIRRLLSDHHIDLERPRPGARQPVGEELLPPTRIFAPAIDSIADSPGVHGLAHISGGGVRNLLRLNRRWRFVLDSWPAPPPIFSWLAGLGKLTDRELYQTFNMGVGFVAVVARAAEASILLGLKRAGVAHAEVIGSVEEGQGVSLPSLGLDYRTYS